MRYRALAATWASAFGEGLATLAAAGGPEIHPHAVSAPEGGWGSRRMTYLTICRDIGYFSTLMRTNRQVKRARTEPFLARHAVFSLDEFAEELGLGNRRGAALQRVKYQIAQGRVRRVLRGVYATVPLGVDPARLRPDRFLVAAVMRSDAVFSHHAALELLGVAHSDWNTCTVMSERRGPRVRLDGVEIRFFQHPAALKKTGNSLLGTTQVERFRRVLRVTGPERTLVDGFSQPGLAGGLEELVESAAGFGVLDLDLLRRILTAYRQKTLWAAAGWFLEQYRRTFFVSEEFLQHLETNRPESPQYLPRSRRRGGTFVSRWNLILPSTVTRLREPDET